MKRILALAVLASVAMLPGCESSDPVANADNEITVFAQPANIPLDINGEGKSTITAEVVDDNGTPVEGIAITFVTDGGELASNGARRSTDKNGRVTDTLTVGTDSEGDTIKVKALSGKRSGEVDVTVGGGDEPPVAKMRADPLGEVHTNVPVTYDASQSTDDVRIVRYRWTLTSTNPDPTIPANLQANCTRPGTPSVEVCVFDEGATPGSAQKVMTRSYTNAQEVTVQLDVFDTVGQLDSAVLSPANTIAANFPPVANAGNNAIANLNRGFTLSGALSSDVDGTIKRYDWDMGDGTQFINNPTGPTVAHAYVDYALCGTPPARSPGCAYDVKLTVYDDGTPNVPGYSCNQNLCTGFLFAQDGVNVTVFPPLPPLR